MLNPREPSGNRRAILLIHGILSSSKHFDFLLPHIPEDLPCYDLLLDGHGGNVEDFSRTSMKKWKAQVSAKVQQLLAQYDELIIVAHSMGTLFCIDEALRLPQQVCGLFLMASPLRIGLHPSAISAHNIDKKNLYGKAIQVLFIHHKYRSASRLV